MGHWKVEWNWDDGYDPDCESDERDEMHRMRDEDPERMELERKLAEVCSEHYAKLIKREARHQTKIRLWIVVRELLDQGYSIDKAVVEAAHQFGVSRNTGHRYARAIEKELLDEFKQLVAEWERDQVFKEVEQMLK